MMAVVDEWARARVLAGDLEDCERVWVQSSYSTLFLNIACITGAGTATIKLVPYYYKQGAHFACPLLHPLLYLFLHAEKPQ